MNLHLKFLRVTSFSSVAVGRLNHLPTKFNELKMKAGAELISRLSRKLKFYQFDKFMKIGQGTWL